MIFKFMNDSDPSGLNTHSDSLVLRGNSTASLSKEVSTTTQQEDTAGRLRVVTGGMTPYSGAISGPALRELIVSLREVIKPTCRHRDTFLCNNKPKSSSSFFFK